MIFYRIDGTIIEQGIPGGIDAADIPEDIYLCRYKKRKVSFCLRFEDFEREQLQRVTEDLCSRFSLIPESLNCSELTLWEAWNLLEMGKTNGSVLSVDTIFAKYHISGFSDHKYNFYEEIIQPVQSQQAAEEACRKLICNDMLLPEIRRIFAPSAADAPKIHPVHYVILSDSKELREEMKHLLLGSLAAAGRLGNYRYSTLTTKKNLRTMQDHIIFDPESAERMYAMEKGGTIIVQPSITGTFYTRTAGNNTLQPGEIHRIIQKNHRDVLTVLEGSSIEEEMIRKITGQLKGMTFVWIREDRLGGEAQLDYLRSKAAADGLNPAGLEGLLPANGHALYLSELNQRYDQWLVHSMQTEVYPQYAHVNTLLESAPQTAGSDYIKLQEMIGLEPVKQALDRIIAYHRMKNYEKSLGLPAGNASIHMAFTGNPGTAKTTVARLFAGILRDNGILKNGALIETGRSDLVDRYVGGTALKVKEVFNNAKGNILFIDEAYSLVDDRNGSFGDEAINIIVQEMENSREDTVVIFAGYPKEMELFLNKNPGLSGRIAFHIHFSDYSEEELLKISRLLAKDMGKIIAPDAETVLLKRFQAASRERNFGNGRFARNCVEQACMKQAHRLMKPGAAPTYCELEMLTAEDFSPDGESPAYHASSAGRKIGFTV